MALRFIEIYHREGKVVTFLTQGIKPSGWGEAERAKIAARRAIAIWIVLLIILAVIIYFDQQL